MLAAYILKREMSKSVESVSDGIPQTVTDLVLAAEFYTITAGGR